MFEYAYLYQMNGVWFLDNGSHSPEQKLDLVSIIDVLNFLGEENWELVATEPHKLVDNNIAYILKTKK